MSRTMNRAPADAHEIATEILGELGPDRILDFQLRLDRWWETLASGVERLYGHLNTETLLDRLVALAAAAYRDRDPALHELDRRRLLQPDWLQLPDRIGYACYADRFAGDLAGVGERVDYLQELGVTQLHLMPALRPREGDSDGGYAVVDYRDVRPDLGTIEDVRQLATTLRGAGISLVMDLVLNHVAYEHEWAVRAREGIERYRDYFYVFPDRTMPDRYEQNLPEVFPDFAPGNFTWDDDLDGWVWTTFNEFQWDVNWSNPEVLTEYADIIFFLANLGVEVLRLDAIAFTFKRLGTNCQNQPEVHELTAVLRALAHIACPAVAFKAEAIVGPRDLVPYLGTGKHAGRVSDLAYQNSFMVQIWSMIASGSSVLARHALGKIPRTPSGGTWIAYHRCHDDIGWAIDDTDAGEIQVSGYLHRRYLADWYSGDFPGSWSRGLTFQYNPVTGDKRTSGTAASLVGIDPQRDARSNGAALARLYLANAMIYGFGGIPMIWSGDELGMTNDPGWADEPGHEDDNRWAHRPRLDWTLAEARHDPTTVAGAVFASLQHLGRVRSELDQLHAAAEKEIVQDSDESVFAVIHRHAAGNLVTVYNVARDPRPLNSGLFWQAAITDPWNALGSHPITWGEDGIVWLPPYAAWWVIDAPAPER